MTIDSENVYDSLNQSACKLNEITRKPPTT